MDEAQALLAEHATSCTLWAALGEEQSVPWEAWAVWSLVRGGIADCTCGGAAPPISSG
ncbi:hypothetical protein ACWDR1_32430 [Streptosporangium sandarakinum]